ncbi:MAG TPA: pyridoxal phosphate-dependent aminotransferase [Pyrinomonadaceae bacterium]|nr:pyridoxal phosphate-dependent aminotransferase [Pyrinomonadaceae bacterium]
MKQFQPPSFLAGIEKSVIRQISDRATPDCIRLGLGEPDLPTPQFIRDAATRVIQQEQNGYTLQAGLPALQEQVAKSYPHLRLSPEDVIITAGSQEAMYLALMTLVRPGDEVLIPNPGFVAYATITQMAGGRAVYYRLPAEDNFSFDKDEFRRAINEKTRVVICTSPSNPTGRAFTQSELQEIANAVQENGSSAYIVSDEIYRDLYYTRTRPGSISEYYPNTIVISGLSKSLSMTGWRLGWMCGNRDVIASALVLHGYVTTCANTVSQKTALVAWSDEADSARAHHRKTFHTRRDHLLQQLSRAGFIAIEPEGAFYTMVDIREHGSSMEIAERLLEAGVVTIPGSAFGSEGEGFLRVSFCADLPALEEGVKRMALGLKSGNGNG